MLISRISGLPSKKLRLRFRQCQFQWCCIIKNAGSSYRCGGNWSNGGDNCGRGLGICEGGLGSCKDSLGGLDVVDDLGSGVGNWGSGGDSDVDDWGSGGDSDVDDWGSGLDDGDSLGSDGSVLAIAGSGGDVDDLGSGAGNGVDDLDDWGSGVDSGAGNWGSDWDSGWIQGAFRHLLTIIRIPQLTICAQFNRHLQARKQREFCKIQ